MGNAFSLVLYQPEIAQNAGAATRAAACFGADLEIIEPCGFPLDAKAFRRVAMDYGLIAPPRIHACWPAFVERARNDSRRLILLSTKAATTIWAFDFQPGDCLVLGQESAGAPPPVWSSVDASVRIPIAPGARSLNMATAGAVALAAARRAQPFED